MTSEFCLCPLYPFDSDCEDLDLIGGIHIKPAPDNFKQSLSDRYLGGENFWDDPFRLRAAWVAELPFLDRTIDELQKAIQTEKLATMEILSDMLIIKTQMVAYCFVTALKLYKEGLVTPGPIAIPTSDDGKPMWLFPDWLNISSKDYMFEEPKKYVLKHADIPEVNNLLVDMYKWKMSKEYSFIEVALNRFHSAYTGEPEEKLIDQMIAFEAIYLGDIQELKYKLSMRTAFFISKSPKEKKDIYKDMLRAYKLRSDIVHGSDKVHVDSIETILPKTEDYLRRSIRKILSLLPELPKSKENRQKWFDDKILGHNNFSLEPPK